MGAGVMNDERSWDHIASTSTTTSSSSHQQERVYANQQIPAFLALPQARVAASPEGHRWSQDGMLQIVHDGSFLTAKTFKHILNPRRPVLIQDSAASIGMQLPAPRRHRSPLHSGGTNSINDDTSLTVRDIAEYVGYGSVVNVIDVEHQDEMEGWTFSDLVDYFEDEDRVMAVVAQNSPHAPLSPKHSRTSRTKAQQQQSRRHRVLNQISYEFSHTALADHVRSPTFVRDLDWIDQAWPKQSRKNYPVVQYYCLTSAAGCYTDFHIDFGGTSVWYHVLEGSKEFCLIPPNETNKRLYENWLCHKNQASIFLADWIDDKSQVLRVALQQHQTMIIPAGWIHAVYTPQDSLVFGGNFLHGMDIQVQLDTYGIEVRSKVMEKFRFPYFKTLQFYAGGMYLRQCIQGRDSHNPKKKKRWTPEELEGLPHLVRSLESWWAGETVDEGESYAPATIPGAAQYAAQTCGCETVDEFLQVLRAEVDRIVAAATRTKKWIVPPNPALQARLPALDTTKLRVKINSSSSNQQQQQQQQQQHQNSSSDDDDSNNKFRIQLSQTATRPDPLPSSVKVKVVARSKPREDLYSYSSNHYNNDDDSDDEWSPSQSELNSWDQEQRSMLRVHSKRGSTSTSTKRRTKRPAPTATKRPVKKVKTTSARSRLLKKM